MDGENYGLCAVIPFVMDGHSYDASKGGKLVIHELKVAIEVRPGVPILFPSALYQHYNTALNDAGFRCSFTAWFGGALVQWADLGGRAKSELSVEEAAAWDSKLEQRIQEWVDIFPCMEEGQLVPLGM